jgi:1-acyl-sn-glycerol-3-phosphate acyltransferase
MAGVLASLCGIRIATSGATPAKDQPAVIVSNHPSLLDGLALIMALPDPVVFVSSTDLERQPIIGSFLRRIGCAFVERGDPRRSADTVTRLSDLVRRGHSIAVLPEGSITRAPGLRPFRLGAFAIATSTACPILPIGIRGTRDILRPGTYLPRRGSIRVTVGAAIPPPPPSFDGQVQLRDTTHQIIARLSSEPLVPAQLPG